jgi:hypothetical protein
MIYVKVKLISLKTLKKTINYKKKTKFINI